LPGICIIKTLYLSLLKQNERTMKDLFETPELIPSEVQAILDKYSEMDNTYTNCGDLIDELESVGYTCDYGLDAEPYGLRPMGIELTEFLGWEDIND